MKVIAKFDAPIVKFNKTNNWAEQFNMVRAYKTGDIFQCLKSSVFNSETQNFDFLVIYHPIIQSSMEVNPENFELLELYREKQIQQIIN